jgi:hypothetical protein
VSATGSWHLHGWKLTLDVATFESGLVRELRISIRGSVYTLRESRMAGAVFGV